MIEKGESRNDRRSEYRAAVQRLIQSRVEQGLPAKLEDPSTLARIAALLVQEQQLAAR